jgi:crossover junction endodeoxyribonuclease RuvC
MFVLGIDPGLSVTGYAVLTAGARPRAVAAGALRTDPGDPVPLRLAELFGDVEELIAEFSPQEVAIEQVFVNRNLQTATSVGRASGVILLAAQRAGLPVHEYTPTAVKMAVAGVGNADKAQVQQVVARRLGLDTAPKPADAADALAIALCHVQSSSLRRAVERAGR